MAEDNYNASKSIEDDYSYQMEQARRLSDLKPNQLRWLLSEIEKDALRKQGDLRDETTRLKGEISRRDDQIKHLTAEKNRMIDELSEENKRMRLAGLFSSAAMVFGSCLISSFKRDELGFYLGWGVVIGALVVYLILQAVFKTKKST